MTFRQVVPCVWVALSLALPAAGAEPTCKTDPAQPSLQVCYETKEQMKAGRSTTLRIWVEGTRKPVEVRVHNSSPDIIRLEGGVDQIIRVGRKEVEIKLKTLRPGTASYRVHLHSRDAVQEAARIAAEVAPQLAAWQARFSRERAALPPGGEAALLDRTEAGLMGILSYPELAAMRDYVRNVLRDARRDLQGFQETTAAGRVMLAAFASNDSALDTVAKLIARLLDLSRKNDYVVNLCVTSLPKSGAHFDMEPESYPDGGSDTVTAGRLVNIYRGSYIYRATLKRAKPIECKSGRSCRPLNLIDDPRTLLVCDFNAGLCRRSDDALPEGCRGKN